MDETINIAGIVVNNLSRQQAVDKISSLLKTGERHYICFVNAEAVVLARHNKEFLNILSNAALRLVDGIGMQLAARLDGKRFIDNCNGTDLFPLLCELLNEMGSRVFLLGGRSGRAQKTCEWITQRYPKIKIAGTSQGYFSKQEERGMVTTLRNLKLDVILVGLGSPNQEFWINRNLGQIGAKVAIGVGGLFDYYSGSIQRAPKWIRKIGFEWVWRILIEPKRWYRLLRLFEFIYIIFFKIKNKLLENN